MPNKTPDDFSLENYKETLRLAKRKGYKFLKFNQLKDLNYLPKKRILLRHDVDTQLEIALKIAQIEKSIGVDSTFFIRMHSHNYNPLCIKDTKKIIKIAELGHEIGFHYEPDYYKLCDLNFEKVLAHEIEILQSLSKQEIIAYAPHEPSRTGIKEISFDIKRKKIEAYDKNLFANFKYISDSSCRWREGSMRYHIENETYQSLYILTHPYWWYEKSPIENY